MGFCVHMQLNDRHSCCFVNGKESFHRQIVKLTFVLTCCCMCKHTETWEMCVWALCKYRSHSIAFFPLSFSPGSVLYLWQQSAWTIGHQRSPKQQSAPSCQYAAGVKSDNGGVWWCLHCCCLCRWGFLYILHTLKLLHLLLLWLQETHTNKTHICFNRLRSKGGMAAGHWDSLARVCVNVSAESSELATELNRQMLDRNSRLRQEAW